jgi:hypothetical protein
VYLGDLAHARRYQGRTFTGIAWQFYKFGPWAQEVNERVQPALLSIGANVRTFESNFEGKEDWVRWSLRDDQLLHQRERTLPPCVTLHLRPEIRKFGKDTPSLLDYVYRTPPMLSAAPHEYLDFAAVAQQVAIDESPAPTLRAENLSAKKKKGFKERIAALQQSRKHRVSKKLINPVRNPRYDAVYQEGLAWLDELAGEPLEPGEKIAEFSDTVWKSSTRKGGDVS